MARQSNKEKTAIKAQAKVISMHLDEDVYDEKQSILQQAEAAEKNGDLESAEKLYKELIKQKAFNAAVYTRLMIIYRKQKMYKEELNLINKGIKTFEEFYEKKTQKLLGRHKGAERLSNALAKSLGQKGKNVKEIYLPEPIPKWIRRRSVVEKKVKSL